MTPPPTDQRPINDQLPPGRKATQRRRLIEAVVLAANRDGYANTSVASVVGEAKVSKPTFYQYFRTKDDCFLAAVADIQEQLHGSVRMALADAPPPEATAAGIGALIEFAISEPARARYLISEVLSAGPAALALRDQGISEISATIEADLDKASPTDCAPDIPIDFIIGGLYRVLGSRLRRRERVSDALARDLLKWVKSYEVPVSEHRWRSMMKDVVLETSPYLPATRMRAPEVLPPGRPSMSDAEVEANQRVRILDAAGDIAVEKGYAATTVTAIVKRAHVDLRVFYRLFTNKEDVFLTAQKLGMEETMMVSAAAFFAGDTWAERCWQTGLAFTQFLDANPRLGRVGVIESYAVGRDGAQRVEDGYLPFTIFLQEGLQHCTRPDPPGTIAFEAIVATYFEIVYRQVRASDPPNISGALPNISSIWLTPFLGAAPANSFIDSKTAPGRKMRRPPKTS
jgi:AcrR family transcriptional regulator